jgi:hypothetical protein
MGVIMHRITIFVVTLLLLQAEAWAATITGELLLPDGKPQTVQNLRFRVTLSGTNQPVPATISPPTTPNTARAYTITVNDDDIATLSKQVKGRVDIRFSVLFRSDGNQDAILENIAVTSSRTIDVVMPIKQPCQCCNSDTPRRWRRCR